MDKRIVIKRIVAFVIDWNLVFLICVALLLSGPQFKLEYLALPRVEMFSSYGVILGLLGFVLLPLIRDCILKNASVGKRIMGLRVVDVKTWQPPSLGKLILRNVMFYFPAVEFILVLVNNGASVGDMISGTAVVEKRSLSDANNIN